MFRINYSFILISILLALMTGCKNEKNNYNINIVTNNVNIQNDNETVNWSYKITTNVTFKIQISETSDFKNIVIDEGGIKQNEYMLPKGKLKPNFEYFWRVKDETDNTDKAWSETKQLIINTINTNSDYVNITNGLIAYYPFKGNTNDQSGNGNNLTNYGATLSTDRFGNIDNAYEFNGSNNYLIVSNSNHPTKNVTVTYSVWIYYSGNLNVGQHASVVDVGNAGDSYPSKRSALLIWKNTTSNDLFTYCEQSNDFAFKDYNINNNQWIHVLIIKTSTNIILYINGSFIESGSIKSNQNVTSTKISIGGNGNLQHANGEYFRGKIDDIRIYNRALSDNEISQLYNEGGWK